MDYAENSKMMEEEEVKEYLFPQNDYRLVKFNTFNTEQQLNSIFVGSLITEIGEDKYIRLKSGENQLEKDKLKQMYQQENSELREKLKKLEKRKREREREVIEELREEKTRIRNELLNEFTLKTETINTELLMLRKKVELLGDKRLVMQKEHHNTLSNQKDEMERKLTEQRENYEKKLDELREKLINMSNITNVSSKKGQEGENWVFNELVRQFKSSQVEDCHAKGHKGDFTVSQGEMKGMFESKNYTRNVPKREIKKFRSDIENNADLRYGVMLSLKSGIVNHNDLSLEFCAGKPLVYLHMVKDEPFKIKIAYDICQLILKNIDCFDITKEETQLKLKEKVKVITSRHKSLVCKVTDFSNDMKNTLNDQWRDFEEFLGHINLSE
jgi:hypothetical protein